jgi:tRNA(His) guanylyltransferase
VKFERLDRRMRVYETAHDHCVLPGVHIVARIDGRSFSHLTREGQGFEAPYDEGFRDAMVATLQHLATGAGFGVLYGYTQSDELSILLRRDEATFGRKLRKLLSVLASEATSRFVLALGRHAAFDARISQLPRDEDVVDYFRWRQEDALRNALNGHAYWLLRRRGMGDREATDALKGVGVPARQEMLFEAGINFNDLPAWQKAGIGIYFTEERRRGTNPKTGEATEGVRRRAVVDAELPVRGDYDAFLRELIARQ